MDLNWEFKTDRYFVDWLKSTGGSITVCSYKTNNVFCIGTTFNSTAQRNVVSMWITKYPRPMASNYVQETKQLYLGTLNKICQFYNNGSSKTNSPELTDFDTTFLPRQTNIINDIDIHDLVVDKNDKVFFCSALFSCVCERSISHNFKVHWRPPWISKIAREDRCHLNGLCCRDGVPRYVTAICRRDHARSWDENKMSQGVVFDIITNELVCKNITMPHSPVFRNGKLWILESGTGYLGYVDFSTTLESEGESYHPFVPEIFIPGFIRGISFINDTQVIIGSSLDRHEQCFQCLPLEENLKLNSISPKCGLFIVDVESMDIIHFFHFTNHVNEIYDITFIPNSKRSMVVEDENHNIIDKYNFTE